jgi:hypothetical protein
VNPGSAQLPCACTCITRAKGKNSGDYVPAISNAMSNPRRPTEKSPKAPIGAPSTGIGKPSEGSKFCMSGFRCVLEYAEDHELRRT